MARRSRSDGHLTGRSSASTTTTIGIDYGYLEDKVTLQEAGGRALPDPGHEVDHTGDDC